MTNCHPKKLKKVTKKELKFLYYKKYKCKIKGKDNFYFINKYKRELNE